VTSQTTAIVGGGVLPAIILGVFGVMQKTCMSKNLGIGPFFVIVGGTTAVFGLVYCLATGSRAVSLESGSYAAITGLLWCLGTGLIVFAVSRYGGSISQLAPLYNMNTLVVVLLGLLVFSEWKQVQTLPLLIGAALIVIGAALVARA